MGQVLMRAGGGKVTVDGLTADIVQQGKTVTVKQGSKVVQSVTGSYLTPMHVFLDHEYSYIQYLTIRVTGYSAIRLSGWANYNELITFLLDGTEVYRINSPSEINFDKTVPVNGANNLLIRAEGNSGRIYVDVT